MTSGKRQPSKQKRLKKSTDKDDEDAAAASLLAMVGGGTNDRDLSSDPTILTTKKSQQRPLIDDDDDDEEEEEDLGPPPLPMDPESTLDVLHCDFSSEARPPLSRHEATLPNTVHWDPHSPDGRKIGWKVKIEHGATWLEGRIVRYDPHTHKHKIQFNNDNDQTCWIWLRSEQHNLQLATRLVWAHVKGYAWWPALVMESNVEASKTKDGYVSLEFFGTSEVSCLRDRPDTVRPLDPGTVDAVVARHKKKRNQRAYQLAVQEYQAVRRTRQAAAVYYARMALHMANFYAPTSLSASSSSSSVNNNNNNSNNVETELSSVQSSPEIKK